MTTETSTRSPRYLNRVIARELSRATRYFDELIQLHRLPHDSRELFELIDAPIKRECKSVQDLSTPTSHQAVLFRGTFNHHFDVEGLLRELKPKLNRSSRVFAVLYNPYFNRLYRLANLLGLRQGELPSTFITETALANISRLAGYELVALRPIAACPWHLFGIGALINRIVPAIPVVRWLGSVCLATLRPILREEHPEQLKLSIVIPARNEKGNIENALKRMPKLPTRTEIIFVEGNSTDDTWGEIQRVSRAYSREHSSHFEIQTLQQKGKGKNDAVRLGFSHATGDLLTIWDADLTMPPELLGRFLDAYLSGQADFVNGSRLVYPMEGEAMRFLNHLGNIFFAKALSSVLGARLSDSLCGTKLVSRKDYARFTRWRRDFGDFDPFGDFELIFPAAILGLGIIDVPIRYLARTYGTTNIHRFRHGLILLKMTWVGFRKIKLGAG